MASTSPAMAPGIIADSPNQAKISAAGRGAAATDDRLWILAATGLGIAGALMQASRRRRLSSGI